MEIPRFQTNKELFDFLSSNKDALIATKMATIKHADSVCYDCFISSINVANKAEGISSNPNVLTVKAVINTTNILDSHGDVHLPGIWKKSIQENKRILMLQEHSLKFDSILARGADLEVLTKEMSWRELGYDADGKTEALIFNATLRREKNNAMFDRYKNNEVDNHSVGMRYIKVLLGINNKDYGNEYEIWEKYINQVVNKEYAERKGYMWIVKEAQIVEGSAVPLGSNFVTPTISTNKHESDNTHKNDNEPSAVTLDEAKTILAETFKTFCK